jgi:hypothetical protein
MTNKIHIIGVSCVGKSTYAVKLSASLGLPVLPNDFVKDSARFLVHDFPLLNLGVRNQELSKVLGRDVKPENLEALLEFRREIFAPYREVNAIFEGLYMPFADCDNYFIHKTEREIVQNLQKRYTFRNKPRPDLWYSETAANLIKLQDKYVEILKSRRIPFNFINDDFINDSHIGTFMEPDYQVFFEYFGIPKNSELVEAFRKGYMHASERVE